MFLPWDCPIGGSAGAIEGNLAAIVVDRLLLHGLLVDKFGIVEAEGYAMLRGIVC